MAAGGLSSHARIQTTKNGKSSKPPIRPMSSKFGANNNVAAARSKPARVQSLSKGTPSMVNNKSVLMTKHSSRGSLKSSFGKEQAINPTLLSSIDSSKQPIPRSFGQQQTTGLANVRSLSNMQASGVIQ